MKNKQEKWLEIFGKEEIIFARTLPHHKLMIVKQAQAYGHIVAVSGDGVNDAPALKSADLGISMNKTGADVSKEAAGMILLDDNFATVVEGVKEGRAIFANLKKCIRYTLAHTIPETFPSFLFILGDFPLMLTSFLVLLIDMCTEMIPAISYAWEEQEGDLMTFPPRKIVVAPDVLELKRKKESQDNIFKRIARTIKHIVKGDPLMEVLIDFDLLFWSYIQAGIILCSGCVGAFLLQAYWEGIDISALVDSAKCFDSKNQELCAAFEFNVRTGEKQTNESLLKSLARAQTAYFFGVVISQWFTLMVVKSR
jgi:sodium/potassium-transporting ATPase subunit alpha